MRDTHVKIPKIVYMVQYIGGKVIVLLLKVWRDFYGTRDGQVGSGRERGSGIYGPLVTGKVTERSKRKRSYSLSTLVSQTSVKSDLRK